jgi:hypothetical protein
MDNAQNGNSSADNTGKIKKIKIFQDGICIGPFIP